MNIIIGSVTLLLLLKLQESCLVPGGTITLCRFIYPNNFDSIRTPAELSAQEGFG